MLLRSLSHEIHSLCEFDNPLGCQLRIRRRHRCRYGATAWHKVAGDELTRFHRAHANLSPANASGVVTNFQQADSDNDGTVSRAEFVQACKLGFVSGGEANRNIATGVSF